LGPEHPYGTLVRVAKVLGKGAITIAGLTPGFDTCLQPERYVAASDDTIAETYTCPLGMRFVMSEDECRDAAALPGFTGFAISGTGSLWPAGCFVYTGNNKLYFNTNTATSQSKYGTNHVRICGQQATYVEKWDGRCEWDNGGGALQTTTSPSLDLTLLQCQGKCSQDPDCLFMGYTASDPYADRRAHCMLWSQCSTTARHYLSDIWKTYTKIVWYIGAKGASCDETCNVVGKRCNLEALLSIDSSTAINNVAARADTACDGAQAWAYDSNPAICTDPSCCNGDCINTCTFGTTSGRSCTASDWTKSRICACEAH